MRRVMLGLLLLFACRTKPPTPTQAETKQEPPPPVAAAPQPMPPPAPPAARPAAPDPCPSLCARTSALHCKNGEGCLSNCREMVQIAACGSEMAKVLRCFEREPMRHWECNELGEPAIKDGYCDAEQGKFVACAQSAQGAPGPAKTEL
jgi:hypothetical protein